MLVIKLLIGPVLVCYCSWSPLMDRIIKELLFSVYFFITNLISSLKKNENMSYFHLARIRVAQNDSKMNK